MTGKRNQKPRHLPAFILLTLAEGQAYGGEIYHSLIDRIPNFQCDQGAIYRALKQLEGDNAVNHIWDMSDSGAAKKIYRITEVGLSQLDGWKKDIEQRIVYLETFLDRYQKLKND